MPSATRGSPRRSRGVPVRVHHPVRPDGLGRPDGVRDGDRVRHRARVAAAVLGARLAELTRRGGYKIGTGFVGTPIIQDALTRTGHLDTAPRLLVQTENPSWLYPVTMGATTIWERWDSMLPDGTINPGEMTSFNHYALGAIGDWLHRVVAGLAPDAPGYARIRIAPHRSPGSTSRPPSTSRPYGRARAGVDARAAIASASRPSSRRTRRRRSAARRRRARGGLGNARVGGGSPTPPAAPRRHVGLDSSLAAVIDDPEAYRDRPRGARGGEARGGARVPHEHQVDARTRSGEAMFQQTGPEAAGDRRSARRAVGGARAMLT